MQQIINAILNNRNFFIYLLLLFLSFLILRNNSPYHQSQFRQLSLSVSGSLLGIRNSYQNYFGLKEENARLVAENLHLKSKLSLLKLHEDPDSIVNKRKTPWELIPARIIKNSIDGVRNFIILDKGSRDSLTVEMGVIGPNGIVGIIDQTNSRFASVISLLHRDLKINAKLNKGNAFGSLYWPGIAPNKMMLSDIPTINTVSVGDTVVTGGMSAYFPSGIPIGKVSKFEILPSKRYYQIEVILFNNFSNLDHVYVIKNKDKSAFDALLK